MDNSEEPEGGIKTPYFSSHFRHGSNGQIQLWQFLLELLMDSGSRDIIRWVGDDGEFMLVQPESVAKKWGERKNKPAMNYEKLSRALRYYYDGQMINKVKIENTGTSTVVLQAFVH